MGGYIIEESLKVPKTVLEDVWDETLTRLKENHDFKLEAVEKIESIVKESMIIPEEIIDILKD